MKNTQQKAICLMYKTFFAPSERRSDLMVCVHLVHELEVKTSSQIIVFVLLSLLSQSLSLFPSASYLRETGVTGFQRD